MDVLQSTIRMMRRFRVFWIILLAVVFLSGCVQYDVGVKFQSPHRGEFVQHVQLSEQFTSFSNSEAKEWLSSVERRAKRLQGKVKRLSDREIVVKIPFNSGKELETKVNQFFNPVQEKGTAPTEAIDLPNLNSKLTVKQNNFLLLQRNRLVYDLDLRSLGVLSNNGKVIVNPSSLFDLKFSLQTPWGAKSIVTSEALKAETYEKGHQLLWTLQPGQVNHIEAVFWMPSPLGLGTVAIALLVIGGFYFKYKQLPWSSIRSSQTPALS